MNYNLRYHHFGSFWTMVLSAALGSSFLGLFVFPAAEKAEYGALLFYLALASIFALIFCFGESWPCIDYKERVIRRFLSSIKIAEVSEMTRDYHLSFDKNGKARETFTVRLLGRFGSKDIRFGTRRKRDEFEYVMQAAMNEEAVGNTNISPAFRYGINIVLALVIFCFTVAAMYVGISKAKESYSLQTSSQNKLSATSSEYSDTNGTYESNPGYDVKVSDDKESSTSEVLREPKDNKNDKTELAAGTSENIKSPRSDAILEPKSDDSFLRPNATKLVAVEGASKSNSEGSLAVIPVNSPSENMAIARSNESPTSTKRSSDVAQLQLKNAEFQGELAVINAKIEAERKRWHDANAAINALTNNKTVPVIRNSPQHVQMYQAQVIMKDVEAGAPSLKEEKSRLEAKIKSIQDSISSK